MISEYCDKRSTHQVARDKHVIIRNFLCLSRVSQNMAEGKLLSFDILLSKLGGGIAQDVLIEGEDTQPF